MYTSLQLRYAARPPISRTMPLVAEWIAGPIRYGASLAVCLRTASTTIVGRGCKPALVDAARGF